MSDNLLAARALEAMVDAVVVGDRDGRIALYLTESLPHLLLPQASQAEKKSSPEKPERELSEKAKQILDFLAKNGASFFSNILAATGGGFPNETRDALWELLWAGKITNDTFQPVRDLLRSAATATRTCSTVATTENRPQRVSVLGVMRIN